MCVICSYEAIEPLCVRGVQVKMSRLVVISEVASVPVACTNLSLPVSTSYAWRP